MKYVRVAVPVPLGQAFTYALPDELADSVRRGSRVLCELGSRKVLGVALDLRDDPGNVPLDKLKPIRAVVDTEPALPDELLDFLLALTRYYLAPVGEVMRLALPSVERSEPVSQEQTELLREAKIVAVGKLVHVARAIGSGDVPSDLKGKSRELYQCLLDGGEKPLSDLSKQWKSARDIVQRLATRGLVNIEQRARNRDPFVSGPIERDSAPVLTPEQRASVDAICGALDLAQPNAFLLHGVTASGKTEVYLHAVQHCLAQGGCAIVLVPEIALTPQLVARFRARLGDEIAVMHSGIGSRERHAMWKRIREGTLRVVVGARSALFAPVAKLALICVDEEHDSSFKQEEGVRYNARDMALMRCQKAGAVCVLGSATPSTGSDQLCRTGRLALLRLPARARAVSALPEVEIVDLRRIGAGPTAERLLSFPLHRALERVLETGEQAILFLNRRGFAPSMVCEDCGAVVECPHCSVALTLHRSRGERLVCHYCDFSCAPPRTCDKCKGARFSDEGAGTERIEQRLTEAFPKARIARLDRDVAAGAKSEKILDRMRRGEVDILVGTQMVTKGHDLPNVTLVGVLNADAALSMPDFRAAERTFQLIVQVAGRAGRADRAGRVIVQTRQPEHPAIVCAARHDVEGFLVRELADRRELDYPPYTRLALVRVDSTDESCARGECERLASVARRAASGELQVLGPAPAPIARLRNRYRFRFVLKAKQRPILYQTLLAVLRAGADRSVRVGLDVDPMNML